MALSAASIASAAMRSTTLMLGTTIPRRAHLVEKPLRKRRPIGQADGLPLEPDPEFGAQRRRQIAVAEARLDRGELVVARRGAPGEAGDHVRLDTDLLGDVIEHDLRQHLATAQMATGMAKTAQLKRVAEPGLGRCARPRSRRGRRGRDCGGGSPRLRGQPIERARICPKRLERLDSFVPDEISGQVDVLPPERGEVLEQVRFGSGGSSLIIALPTASCRCVVFHRTMAAATRLRPPARWDCARSERSRKRPVRWKKVARLRAFSASPLFSSRVAFPRSSGRSIQSRVNSVRSMRPISRKARASPFWRGYEPSRRSMADGATVPVRIDRPSRDVVPGCGDQLLVDA